MADKLFVCTQSDCTAREDGKCLEGVTPITNCPHIREEIDETTPDQGQPAQAIESQDDSNDEEVERSRKVGIASADSLDTAGIAPILARRGGTIIPIIGAYRAGKTTLISGVYTVFANGAHTGLKVAGCETLHGFEQISHLARTASGESSPDTGRTEIAWGLRYFHLCLRHLENDELHEVFFADRSGEIYDELLSKPDKAASYEEFARANALVLLIDGDRLSNVESRLATKENAKSLAQFLAEHGNFDCGVRVMVALTKLDIVDASEAPERTRRDFDDVVVAVRTHLGGIVSCVNELCICARPDNTEEGQPQGLIELIDWAIQAPVTGRVCEPDLTAANSVGSRQISRFVPNKT